MTPDNGGDERLRAVFNELKAEDRDAQTTYAGVLARTKRPSARVLSSPVLKVAAAAAILVAAGATYRAVVVREPKLTVPTEVVSLVAWRPETDVLLASPVQLLRAQTQVRESMIDLDTLMTGVVR
jgi:hypothetical protein